MPRKPAVSIVGATTEWLPVAGLVFDEEINRPVNPAKVNGIVRDFNAEAFGIVTVNMRDWGKWNGTKPVIIDAQHRVKAMLQMDYDDQKVECHVYRGLTPQEEARLFLQLNNTSKPGLYYRFANRLRANEEVAVDINKIVRAAGLYIDNQSGDCHITAISALEKVYLGDKMMSTGKNPDALRRTLHVITSAWGTDTSALHGEVIHGIGLFFLRYGKDPDTKVLTEKLAKIAGGASGMLGKARGSREIHGGTVARNVAAIAVDIYNRGRRTGKLASWWAS